MTKSTLHHLRIVTPGVIFWLFLITVLYPYIDLEAIKSLIALPIGIVLTYPVGMLYRTLNVRKAFLGDFWRNTNRNINQSLLVIIDGERQLSDAQKIYLTAERRLMDLFYIIVDASETLKARAHAVYSNGYIVTTLVDIGALSLFIAILHLIGFTISKGAYHIYLMVALIVLFFLSAIIVRRKAEKNHQDLSNEQLRIIERFHTDEVLTYADQFLQRMPRS